MKKKILISTGGSGGHVIPATIFCEQLKNEFEVYLSTDKRGSKFLNLEKYSVTVINTPIEILYTTNHHTANVAFRLLSLGISITILQAFLIFI